MEAILISKSHIPIIQMLSDEQCGKLLKLLFRYFNGEPIGEIADKEISLVFAMCRTMLDVNRKKYEERCERNRKNAKGKSGSERQRVAASGSESQSNININKNTTTPLSGGGGGVNASAPEEKPTTTTTTKFLPSVNVEKFAEAWNNLRVTTCTRLPAIKSEKVKITPHQSESIVKLMNMCIKNGITKASRFLSFLEFLQCDKYLNGRTERRKTPANLYLAFGSEKIIGGIIDDFLALGK